jgi:hypothetical protein
MLTGFGSHEATQATPQIARHITIHNELSTLAGILQNHNPAMVPCIRKARARNALKCHRLHMAPKTLRWPYISPMIPRQQAMKKKHDGKDDPKDE